MTTTSPQALARALLLAAEKATPQKIYLAARYSRSPELRGYRDELQSMGYVVTSRWIDGGHEIAKEGSTEAAELERTRFATEDMADLLAADIVVSFTEEPRKTTTRGGRHVEHGIALATGKRTIVVGHRENVFHCLPQVEFFPAWAGARDALANPSNLTALVTWALKMEARNAELEKALTDARTWHEAEDKALSKQPPSHGPNGNQWTRLQHREQIDLLTAAIVGKQS